MVKIRSTTPEWWSPSIFRRTAFAVAHTSQTWAWRSRSRWGGRPWTHLRSSTFCPTTLWLSRLPQATPTTRLFRRQFHQSYSCAADWSELKKSSDVGFCRRQRRYQAKGDESYVVLKSTIQVSTWSDMPAVTAALTSRDGKRNLLWLAVIPLEKGLFRVTISDLEEPLHERYIVNDVVMDDVKALPIVDSMLSVADEFATISMPDRKNDIRIQLDPFRLDLVTQDRKILVSVNGESRLMMEDYGRTPLFHYSDSSEEKFGDHLDPQHRGPESVGVDFMFPSAEHLCGIPERTSPVSLPETINSDGEVLSEPYRMYNLDVGSFELDKPLGLYGAVPLLYARSGSSALGVFWQNASETYVDVQSTPAMDGRKATHWFSESGIVDMFLLPGPSLNDVFRQYLWLTGSPALPPLFSLGYHQCRYSYEDEADVREVDAGFTSRDIPYDVMWLDIDHTDEKRYFTWDYEKFPDPVRLQGELAKSGRKTVTIVDPHIKRDDSYELHAHASKERLYVQRPDRSDYEGVCWAGISSYPNFLSARVRNEWAKWFSETHYPGMTEHLHIWNDMNEPSVFDGPERTMEKNMLHDGVEHRHVHNLYGYCMARATHEGLVQGRGSQRPFVLSRSFFAGSQRFAAVWTGDNTGSWGHLRCSVDMLVSLQMCGIVQSGADVGGFFGDPDAELVVRWYQAGAFQPFFRGHSNKGTRRREPWMFGEAATACIREAIKARYEFLGYWYTVFAQVAEVGIREAGPPMRAVWWDFAGWSGGEGMWMVGDCLLVAPVMEKGARRHVVELADGRWYDMYDAEREVGGRVVMEVDLGRMVVFLRGGKVVPRMDTEGVRSCADVRRGLYELVVGLDEGGCAEGMGYFDDGESYGFRQGEYCVMRWRFENDRLNVERVDDGEFVGEAVVRKVSVCGFGRRPPRRVVIDENEVAFSHDAETGVLRVFVPGQQRIAGHVWTMRCHRCHIET